MAAPDVCSGAALSPVPCVPHLQSPWLTITPHPGSNRTPPFPNNIHPVGAGLRAVTPLPLDCQAFLQDFLCLLARPRLEQENCEMCFSLRQSVTAMVQPPHQKADWTKRVVPAESSPLVCSLICIQFAYDQLLGSRVLQHFSGPHPSPFSLSPFPSASLAQMQSSLSHPQGPASLLHKLTLSDSGDLYL